MTRRHKHFYIANVAFMRQQDSPGTKKKILQGKPLWNSRSSSANDRTVIIGILICGLEKHSILV